MGPHSKSLYSFQEYEAQGEFYCPPPGWDATCKPMGPHSKSLYLFQEHEVLGSFTLHHPPPPPHQGGMGCYYVVHHRLCSLQYAVSRHKIKELRGER